VICSESVYGTPLCSCWLFLVLERSLDRASFQVPGFMAFHIFSKRIPVLCLTLCHGHFRILSAVYLSCLTSLTVSIISFLMSRKLNCRLCCVPMTYSNTRLPGVAFKHRTNLHFSLLLSRGHTIVTSRELASCPRFGTHTHTLTRSLTYRHVTVSHLNWITCS